MGTGYYIHISHSPSVKESFIQGRTLRLPHGRTLYLYEIQHYRRTRILLVLSTQLR